MSETAVLHSKILEFLAGEFAKKGGQQCVGIDLLYSPGGGFKDEPIQAWSRTDEPELFDVPGNLTLVEAFVSKIIGIIEDETDAKAPGKHRYVLRTMQHLGGRATKSFAMFPSFRGGGDEMVAMTGPGGAGRSDQGVIAAHAGQLMRINAQMFEGTLRVLSTQNQAMREENAALRTENNALRREVEESRMNREEREFQRALLAGKQERQDKVFNRLVEVGEVVLTKMAGGLFEGQADEGNPSPGEGASSKEEAPLPVLLVAFGKSLRPDQGAVLMKTLDAEQRGLFMKIMGQARQAAAAS